MARAADLARGPQNTAPAVSEVVADAACYDLNGGTFRVLQQIHQSLLDQGLISLSAESTELHLAPRGDDAVYGGRGAVRCPRAGRE